MLLTISERLHRLWKPLMVIGIINAILGFALLFPILGPYKLQLLTGLMLLISAFVYGIYMFGYGWQANSDASFFQFVIRLGFGLIILLQDFDKVSTFAWLLAIFFALDAVLTLVEAYRFRDLRSLFVPFLLAGITAALCGLALALHLTGRNTTTAATLLAVNFLVRAVVVIRMALVAKAAVPRLLPAQIAMLCLLLGAMHLNGPVRTTVLVAGPPQLAGLISSAKLPQVTYERSIQ